MTPATLLDPSVIRHLSLRHLAVLQRGSDVVVVGAEQVWARLGIDPADATTADADTIQTIEDVVSAVANELVLRVTGATA